jgi:small-conductance mechanosensitive channel/CRP-like cAMP-binding protein
MELPLFFALALLADAIFTRFVPKAWRITRLVGATILLTIYTVLVVALVGSPMHPIFREKDLPYQFWIEILLCCWWGSAARALIFLLAVPTVFYRTASGNKILSDIIAYGISVCSVLAMMTFVFGFSVQGLVMTSGAIAIILGLALQNTLGDVFSGLSLNVESPFKMGDWIRLEGGIEGQVIQINWRSTRLRNDLNDVVIVPNSSMAKMQIQNHDTLNIPYGGKFKVIIDSRNESEFAINILKHSAMTCRAVLEQPAPSVSAVEFMSDRINYEISFSASSKAGVDVARSQIISQLQKRARPRRRLTRNGPVYLFGEEELLDHLAVFDSLNPEEKSHLSASIVKRHFAAGEEIMAQGGKIEGIHFVYSGVLQSRRKVEDGRVLELRKLGPGDLFGEFVLLTGEPAFSTITALTAGLLLGSYSKDLKPLIVSRPELAESFSRSAARYQQFIAMFDRSALQSEVMAQPDLLSRIKKFFEL